MNPLSQATTAQQLQDLPVGTVVRSAAGTISARHSAVYGALFGWESPVRWDALRLPVDILWRPDA